MYLIWLFFLKTKIIIHHFLLSSKRENKSNLSLLPHPSPSLTTPRDAEYQNIHFINACHDIQEIGQDIAKNASTNK